MPIIKDPKMNPREKAFGILYHEDLDANFKYLKKKNSKNRLLVAGSIVEIDKGKIDHYDEPIIIEGMIISGEINDDFEDKTTSSNAPVIYFLKGNGSTALNRAEIERIMGDDSDVPE